MYKIVKKVCFQSAVEVCWCFPSKLGVCAGFVGNGRPSMDLRAEQFETTVMDGFKNEPRSNDQTGHCQCQRAPGRVQTNVRNSRTQRHGPPKYVYGTHPEVNDLIRIGRMLGTGGKRMLMT